MEKAACVAVKSNGSFYSQFVSSHYSPNTFLLVIAGNMVYNLAVFAQAGHISVVPTRSYLRLTCELISFMLRVVVFVFLWAIWLLKPVGGPCKMEAPKPSESSSSVVCMMQTLYPSMMCVALSIHILLATSETVLYSTSLDMDSLKMAVSGLKVYPLISFFLLHDTKFEAILGAWAFGLAALLTCAAQLRSAEYLTDFAVYAFTSSIIFYDSYRKRCAMNGIMQQLQESLDLNEKLAVEAQALELRAMIGNVAHDLKTVRLKLLRHNVYDLPLTPSPPLPIFFSQPLTSLLSGIECMTDIMSEWTATMKNPAFQWDEKVVAKARATNEIMQNCLVSMCSTNSFMTMTINRCLDYTKTTNGFKLVPKFETVSLKAALEMPSKLVQDAQHAISIDLNEIASDICTHIITDKQWLIENLLCLLSNAAKYSSRGRVEVEVFTVDLSPDEVVRSPRASRADSTTSEVAASSQHLRFEVKDAGIGLSDEAMQGLFNPFKQAQRLAGGTGLGLFSLAKRVEALHGQYGVMRRPDGEQGSVFWFTIPYRPDEMSAKLLKQRAGFVSSRVGSPLTCSMSHSNDSSSLGEKIPVFELPARVEGPFNVLVVDDAPLIVKMTTMLLQRKGHRVQHAVNGANALEKLFVHLEGSTPAMSVDCYDDTDVRDELSAPLFDVVLMDLQMPVLDGIEAIRRLRVAEGQKYGPVGGANRNRNHGRQFVIALSANSDEETRQEALAAGADAFVPKPFTYESFMDVMQMQI